MSLRTATTSRPSPPATRTQMERELRDVVSKLTTCVAMGYAAESNLQFIAEREVYVCCQTFHLHVCVAGGDTSVTWLVTWHIACWAFCFVWGEGRLKNVQGASFMANPDAVLGVVVCRHSQSYRARYADRATRAAQKKTTLNREPQTCRIHKLHCCSY